jgi:hypothetical protein
MRWVPHPPPLRGGLFRQMMRMLRSDWQTKVTTHAHHLPLEHSGSSQEDDAIFGLREGGGHRCPRRAQRSEHARTEDRRDPRVCQREQSPPDEIPVDGQPTGPARAIPGRQ